MILINCLTIITLASVSCHQLSLITRADWNASPSNRIFVKSQEPVSLIVIEYTNSQMCRRKSTCTNIVKHLQQHFMDEKFNDIQYNFLIDSLGNVYEGLGWYSLDTIKHKDQHFRSIGLIGPKESALTAKQKEAITELFRDGMKRKMLNKNYHFYTTEYLIQAMKRIKYDLQVDLDQVVRVEFLDYEE